MIESCVSHTALILGVMFIYIAVFCILIRRYVGAGLASFLALVTIISCYMTWDEFEILSSVQYWSIMMLIAYALGCLVLAATLDHTKLNA